MRRNIATYLDVVFGARAPTESDYFRFEQGGERDWGLQIELCERKLGTKFEADGPNTACYAWLHEHGIGDPDSRSIYYQLLRRRVGRAPQSAKIERVVTPPEDNAAFRIFVRVGIPERRLELCHARNPTYQDIGWMGVLSIDGVDVDAIVTAELEKGGLEYLSTPEPPVPVENP